MNNEKDVEKFYDGVSETYRIHQNRVCDKILEFFLLTNLPKNKKLRILDAGGGVGRFSEQLLKKSHEVVLSDVSEGMLKKAKQNLSSYGNISFVKESVVNMKNQSDGFFDAVIMMNDVLDYCSDYNKAINEVHRVLKKKGIFVGNVNNRFFYCKTHELLEGNYELFEKNMKKGDRYIVWGGQKKGHFSHEFTLEELKKCLENANFKIIKIFGVFNLLDKYEQEKLKDKKKFIELQIKYAEILEYINNSSDFFFVAQK